MKLTVKDVSLEVESLTVPVGEEAATRARRKSAGWKLTSRIERDGGKVTLVFERRKLGAAEVTP